MPHRNFQTPRRTHPTHGILYVDGQPTIVFDTVCTKDRRLWLANSEVHALLRTIWQEANAWLVGRYVIMPDHIHFFAAEAGGEIPYGNWVRYWKSLFTKQHKVAEHRWQVNHWDRRVKSHAAYEDKWNYVRDNAVRKGLVVSADEWPYQSEIYELPWR